MKCILCSKQLESGYLCEEHADYLYNMFKNSKQYEVNSSWKTHCQICGEFENKHIIYDPNSSFFCSNCIVEEWIRYHNPL
jgi:late competence protein required for DNA uptake (superfamily II DNA/RNA helicase)